MWRSKPASMSSSTSTLASHAPASPLPKRRLRSPDRRVAVVRRGAPETAFFAFMGDEHAALIAPGIGETLAPGDPVTLTVPHCDPTVNLYDHYHVVENETLVAIWPVSARGRAR